jgi:hypothetical protein
MGFRPTCVFGVRAEWVRGEELLAAACLQSQPAWMEDHRSAKWDSSVTC